MKHPKTVVGSEASPPLVFDVSTLAARAHLRPTGIERIQLEIALAFVQQSRPDVSFCRFDTAGRRFESVSHAEVQAFGDLMRGASGGATPQRTHSHPLGGAASARRASSLARRITAPIPSARPHIRLMASHGWRAVAEVLRAIRALPSDFANHVPRRFRRQRVCVTTEWSTSTTYCSIGMDWLHNNLDYVAERKSLIGFRTALMVHDLLDEVTPQFSGVDLTDYFLAVLRLADTVVVNSDATHQDLEAFAGKRGLGMPQVVKLPMGSVLRDLAPVRPEWPSAGPDLAEGRFILCVGTITIRKNHHLLFDVWEKMIDGPEAADVPMLVVAGAQGWLSDETMSRLQRTLAFEGVVIHLPDTSDANIAWLYQHCAFTVYPSLYEGWGLPVSESHDFGKVCLTTDRSSLPEAGAGLAELLDPYDRNLWRERIMHFWNDEEARSEREDRVRHDRVRVTARDSADAILDVAGLRRCT